VFWKIDSARIMINLTQEIMAETAFVNKNLE
jgi:DNA-binding XRE family transcriptional regulator